MSNHIHLSSGTLLRLHLGLSPPPPHCCNMGLGILFWMALMVVSQAVSWTYVLKCSEGPMLYRAVWQLALFYTMWALYKKIVLNDTNELGHLSFGFLAVAAFLQHKWLAVAADAVVIANFLLAVSIIFTLDPHDLAMLVKKEESALGIAWAYTFYAYIFSSLFLWSLVLRKLLLLPCTPTYTTLPTTS